MAWTDPLKNPRMQILANSLYEFDRGVRHLFLLTAEMSSLPVIRHRLEMEGVDYYVQEINTAKCNVFFGKSALVETARHIAMKPLNQISPEEDFMLGTLLNYDKERQCLRFLSKLKAKSGICEAVVA